MRRKYDIKNKKSFVVIIILAIAVICIFSLFIYKFRRASKIEYSIETGSIIQDALKNYINIEEDALLKIRWNGYYYLVYQDNKINLGKNVVVYNTVTGGMKLYGSFYEIQEDGKIVNNKGETILSNTTDTKFYKLGDREYLLIDRVITSDDRSIEANNYLLVELDKLGNAKLSNYKLDLKTITPTTLVTSKYTFDIANEILNFGKYDIDLKKIIGTTNQYKPEEDGSGGGGGSGTGDGTGSGDGTGTGTGTGSGSGSGDGTGTGSGSGTGSGTGGDGTLGGGTGAGDIINNNESGNVTDIGELKDKTKMTSIIRVLEGLTQIDIDYVIYDPYNEYKSVYVEVVKDGEIEVVYLSKTDTHLVINNLLPNTEYKLKFVYTTASDDGELIINTYDEMTLKTKMPVYSISEYKISNVLNTLTYKVNLQEGYNIDKVNVGLSFSYDYTDPETTETVVKKVSLDGVVNVNGNDKSVLGTFDISGYNIDKDTLLKLNIVSVEGTNGVLKIDSSYTFRFGR